MKISSFALGPVSANTYIITDEKSGAAAVVDAGDCNGSLLAALRNQNIINVEYILLTHGHFDHILGVYELKNHFPEAKVVIHKNDEKCLSDNMLSLAAGFGLSLKGSVQADISVSDGDTLPFGDGEIKVLHTPGHTKGSVTYLYEDCLFTGDTLFRLSVGRTDFPGGSFEEIEKSCCSLFDMQGDYTVYPGHDMATTLGFERTNNRYINWSR